MLWLFAFGYNSRLSQFIKASLEKTYTREVNRVFDVVFKSVDEIIVLRRHDKFCLAFLAFFIVSYNPHTSVKFLMYNFQILTTICNLKAPRLPIN